MTPILMLAAGSAQAFVGAFVAPEGVTVDHRHAAAVVFRGAGKDGTLLLTSDVDGGATRFAWVVPVVGGTDPRPEAASADDYAELDEWTAPQLVEVTCQDLFPFLGQDDPDETGVDDRPLTGPRSRGRGPWGCSPPDGPSTRPYYGYGYGYYPYYERYDTGRYGGDSQPVVGRVSGPTFVDTDWTFTTVTGDQLLATLEAEALVVSDTLKADLESLLTSDHTFVVAEAALAEPADGRWVTPFQLAFSSSLSPLLVKSGRSTSSGEQDLVIHTLQEGSQRGVAVNYEDLGVETSCLVAADGLDAFYEAELAETFAALPEEAGGAGWTREYEAVNGIEESGAAIRGALLASLGRMDAPSSFVLTRSRVRYDPAVIDKDPALSTNAEFGFGHVRYVVHDDSLESNFPTCNDPFPVDPGSCFDEQLEDRSRGRGRGAMAGLGVALAAGTLWRAWRRRS